MLHGLIISLLFFLDPTLADCPNDQATFSMVYPTKYITISEDQRFSEAVPTVVAESILRELKTGAPKIIFVGSARTFNGLKKSLIKKLGSKLLKDKLILFQAQPAFFQQDVFETFYSSHDNSITIRQFQGYTPQNKGPDIQKLPSLLDLGKIKVKMGKTIDQYGFWLAGVGGNVESTSFGLHLLGKGEFSKKSLQNFASDVFPNSKNVLTLDTSWLVLGHIDEIMVELVSKKEIKDCQSTFLINSPRLGLRLENKPSDETIKINSELQAKFDDYKVQLSNKSKGICRIEFIEAPALYKKDVPGYNRKVYPIAYPSLTNGLLINKHYFVIGSESKIIREHFASSLEKIGIKVVWVPLYFQLYTSGAVDGFLHCLTNSIRVCE